MPNHDAPPRRVDLRVGLLPIRDQGFRSTCLAFAVTAAHEVARIGADGVIEALAEESLYWGCKQIDRDPKPGTTFAAAAAALARWGQPPHSLWPYDDTRTDADPLPIAPTGALDPVVCKLATLRAVGTTIAEIRRRLADLQPVVLGLRLSYGFQRTTDGHIPLPAPGEGLLDRHAVVVVGYEDRTDSEDSFLIIRNSWGASWGDGGYGYLPYAYVERYGAQAWVVDPP